VVVASGVIGTGLIVSSEATAAHGETDAYAGTNEATRNAPGNPTEGGASYRACGC
jgi:hypothetical protein